MPSGREPSKSVWLRTCCARRVVTARFSPVVPLRVSSGTPAWRSGSARSRPRRLSVALWSIWTHQPSAGMATRCRQRLICQFTLRPRAFAAVGRGLVADRGDVLLHTHADGVGVGLQGDSGGAEVLEDLGERGGGPLGKVDGAPDGVEAPAPVGQLRGQRSHVLVDTHGEDATGAGVALLGDAPAVLSAGRHEVQPGAGADPGAWSGAHAAGDPSMNARAAPMTSALLRSRTAEMGVVSPRRGLAPTSHARATSGPSACSRRCQTR